LPVELVVTGDIFFYSKEKIRIKWWVSRNWHCGKMLFVCKKKGISLNPCAFSEHPSSRIKKNPLVRTDKRAGGRMIYA